MLNCFYRICTFVSEIIELFHLEGIKKYDFNTAKSKRYKNFISELKKDIRSCDRSLEIQKQDAENIIQENKEYAPSLTGIVVTVVTMITSFLISVFSLKTFENINPIGAIIVLVVFQFIALKLLNSALKYKRRETAYYKIKLQCINELMEENTDTPRIIIATSIENENFRDF